MDFARLKRATKLISGLHLQHKLLLRKAEDLIQKRSWIKIADQQNVFGAKILCLSETLDDDCVTTLSHTGVRIRQNKRLGLMCNLEKHSHLVAIFGRVN